ncbi:MAG: hypothetical protein KDD52_03930 [Bdellovibrionales bacterium]|nr:hypothetical protein [Bdellovibrionales bacterium]
MRFIRFIVFGFVFFPALLVAQQRIDLSFSPSFPDRADLPEEFVRYDAAFEELKYWYGERNNILQSYSRNGNLEAEKQIKIEIVNQPQCTHRVSFSVNIFFLKYKYRETKSQYLHTETDWRKVYYREIEHIDVAYLKNLKKELNSKLNSSSNTLGICFAVELYDASLLDESQYSDGFKVAMLSSGDEYWKNSGYYFGTKEEARPRAHATKHSDGIKIAQKMTDVGYFTDPDLRFHGIVEKEEGVATMLHEMGHFALLNQDAYYEPPQRSKHYYTPSIQYFSMKGASFIHPLEIAAFYWRFGLTPPKWNEFENTQNDVEFLSRKTTFGMYYKRASGGFDHKLVGKDDAFLSKYFKNIRSKSYKNWAMKEMLRLYTLEHCFLESGKTETINDENMIDATIYEENLLQYICGGSQYWDWDHYIGTKQGSHWNRYDYILRKTDCTHTDEKYRILLRFNRQKNMRPDVSNPLISATLIEIYDKKSNLLLFDAGDGLPALSNQYSEYYKKEDIEKFFRGNIFQFTRYKTVLADGKSLYDLNSDIVSQVYIDDHKFSIFMSHYSRYTRGTDEDVREPLTIKGSTNYRGGSTFENAELSVQSISFGDVHADFLFRNGAKILKFSCRTHEPLNH